MKVFITIILLLFLLFTVSNLGNCSEGFENEFESEMDSHMDKVAEEKVLKSGNFVLEQEANKKYTLSSDGKTCSLNDNGYVSCLGDKNPTDFSFVEINKNQSNYSNIEDSDTEDNKDEESSKYTNVEDSIPNIKINVNMEEDEDEMHNHVNKSQQEKQYNMAGCGDCSGCKCENPNCSNHEEPLQKCIASYGKKIGDTIPCTNSNQCFPLKKKNEKYICPENMPHCADFECGVKWGQCKPTKN